jgi:hypothetical protein
MLTIVEPARGCNHCHLAADLSSEVFTFTPQRFDNFATLSDGDRGLFHRMRVADEVLREACVRRVSDREARSHLGFQFVPALCDMSGVCFPYLVPECSHRVSCRIRRDKPEIVNGKPTAKYRKPYGDAIRFYYGAPASFARIADRRLPLVFVEAEKSVLALQSLVMRKRLRMLVVGMGGCWGWSSKRDVENRDCTQSCRLGHVHDFSYAQRRHCCVLLDANAEHNTDVQKAERALIRTLVRSGATEVRVARLPIERHVNGPDDFLACHADEEMLALLSGAHVVEAK